MTEAVDGFSNRRQVALDEPQNSKLLQLTLGVSLVICDVVAQWRNETVTNTRICLPLRACAWIAAEIVFIFNIPLAVIESIFRGAIALFIVYPLWLCGCLKNDPYLLIEKFPKGAGAALIWGTGISFYHAIYNLNPWARLQTRNF